MQMRNTRLTRRLFLKASGALAASMVLAQVSAPAYGTPLADPYSGVVPMTFPLRRGLYWMWNNWHVPRVGDILPFNHRIRAWLRAHDGVDIFALRGTALYACTAGVVIDVPRPRNIYGNTVWIENASGYRFLYCHLDRVFVNVGHSVTMNTIVGTVGNTGNATKTPSHLHFEIHYPAGQTYTCKYCAPAKGVSALNPYPSLLNATPRVASTQSSNVRSHPS